MKEPHDYWQIIENASFGYARHQIILDDTGKPVDYRFLEVNKSFEDLTGLKQNTLAGRTVREVLPGIEDGAFDWIAYYGKIALEGGEEEFEQYSHPLKKWFRVHVDSKEKLHFTTLFSDITADKKMQQALRVNQENYTSLINSSPNSIYSYDRKGRFTGVNRNLCQTLGLNAGDILGRTHLELGFPEELCQEWAELHHKVLRSGRTVVANTKAPISDGNYRHYQVILTPLRDHKKKISGISGISRDITEHVNKEKIIQARLTLMEYAAEHTQQQLLHKNLEIISHLTHSQSAFYYLVDKDQKAFSLQAWSYEAKKRLCPTKGMRGIPFPIKKADILAQCVRKNAPVIRNNISSPSRHYALPEEHPPIDRELIVPVIRDKKVVAITGVANKPVNYTKKDMEVVEYIADVAREIAEHQRTEALMKKNFSFQNIITDISSTFVTTTEENFDADINTMLAKLGRHFKVDRSYLFMFSDGMNTITNTHEWCNKGVTPQMNRIKNRTMSTFPWWKSQFQKKGYLHIPDTSALPPEAQNEKQETQGQGIKSLINFTVKSKDRTFGLFGFDMVKYRYTWSNNEIDNLIVIANIIGGLFEKLENERSLKEAKEKAEESNRLKTAFVNNISHEVRTPLNGILGFGELITEEGLSWDEKECYYSILESSCQRLQQTITDIMDISAITAGSIKPKPKNVRLGQVMNELVKSTKQACSKKDIMVSTYIPEKYARLYVKTDQELVIKIMRHLLSNAEKFTTNGHITLGYKIKGDQVEFFVKDTGKGIESKSLENIFHPFYQEDISLAGAYGGSGLGLSIAKGLTELLGGSLWVDSQPGKGSSFFFTVPCGSLTTKPEEGSSADIRPGKPGKKTIMIAEDDKNNYLFLKTVTEKAGFIVVHAQNGTDAVELCQQHPEVDLILMDVKMPVMNGLEATAKIKALHPTLPIIALTAYAQIGDREKMLRAGCDNYLAKPVKGKVLIEMIKNMTP